MSSYATDHASALADISDAGADVTFETSNPGAYNPATDTWTGASTSSVTGSAIEMEGDPTTYQALSLIQSDPVTLLFAPTTFGAVPPLDASFTWAGSLYTVRSVEPLRPNGTAILVTVIGAR